MRCSLSIVAVFPRAATMPRVALARSTAYIATSAVALFIGHQPFRQAICHAFQSLDNDKLSQSKDYQLRPPNEWCCSNRIHAYTPASDRQGARPFGNPKWEAWLHHAMRVRNNNISSTSYRD